MRVIPDKTVTSCRFQVLAFQVLAFQVLAFQVLAFQVLAFQVLAFQVLALQVRALQVLAFQQALMLPWGLCCYRLLLADPSRRPGQVEQFLRWIPASSRKVVNRED